MKNSIEIKNLEKNYPDFQLKIDELKIPTGVIVGLIGENGAGKTTLIKLLLNIIQKDNGKIKIFNKDLEIEEFSIKEEIGIVLDNSFFPESLNCKNINTIMSKIYKNWDKELFFKYLEDFKINDTQILKQMSKGMRKKVEIATALSHHPKLLILDEATSGLDPVVRKEVLDIFLEYMEDETHTILMSTHITSDLEHISDYILFINKGKIILDKPRQEIMDTYGILKCDIDQIDKVNQKDRIAYRKNRYNYEILIENKDKLKKKYKNYIVDNITLEDLMLIMIKGDK